MTNTVRRGLLALATLATVISFPAQAGSPSSRALGDSLATAAPTLERKVLDKAIAAMECAVNNGLDAAERLAVIDFSLPSSERRLWIFDLQQRKLVLQDFVAHGQNSGDNFATRFSNEVGSHQTSLGLFRTQETYIGKHGYSLRMDGLEPGINDRARERAIVVHSADYVDPSWIGRQGRIGRSQGCPAVRPEIGQQVVDHLKGGQYMFAYYPDQDWLQSSAYLNCSPSRVSAVIAPLREPRS
jgi:hypothetical protein